MASDPEALPRVSALAAALADQIAAGEVVERPAAVVKELVDNALDAGARRVDVRLRAGGVESIVVVDDGHGIHPDDLALSLTRHATSKLRRAEDLVDVRTLGFRGEALASVAAVAGVRIGSRREGQAVGRWVESRPGKPVRFEPGGMPVGTRVEVSDLFGNVPARRKFLRAEATEVGHIVEAVVRLSLVHPQVRFSLIHGRRTLLELSPADTSARVAELLRRRGGGDPVRHVQGEHDGIAAEAWLMTPSATVRRTAGVLVVVRRRVVREPNLSKLVAAAYADTLAPGQHPVACIWVDPPPGEVDVNVHPQKSEIRFSDPQRVYAAVREVLGTLVSPSQPAPVPPSPRPSLADALGSWDDQASGSPNGPAAPARAAYRLGTRAASAGYARARDGLRDQADQLGTAWARARQLDRGMGQGTLVPDASSHSHLVPPQPQDEGVAAAEEIDSDPATDAAPQPVFLACLPGPTALFQHGDDLLAVDLRALRSHLVYQRLTEDLGGEGIGAQGLLAPVVVKLTAAEVAVVAEHGEALSPLGLWVEPFGAEAVIVRAVPAQLRRCIEDLDVADLVRRVLPWLRVRSKADPNDAAAGTDAAMRVFAQAVGPDPAPRLARTWIRELMQRGGSLDAVAGVHRHRPADLVRERK